MAKYVVVAPKNPDEWPTWVGPMDEFIGRVFDITDDEWLSRGENVKFIELFNEKGGSYQFNKKWFKHPKYSHPIKRNTNIKR